jgi:endonuclease/exonuclease/phosphatase family metal-dependent hydrolase
MRLVSYNIRGGLGMDGRRSVERVADVLREIGTEIACLQEVHKRLPWSGMQDQPRRLARRTGMKALFQSNLKVGPGGYGNALLTNLPLFSRRSHILPNARERASILRSPERRGLLEVLLDAPSGPLAVLVTHWSLSAEDRLEEAEVVGEIVRGLSAPVILAGDFNAEADSPEIARLREITGLQDAAASTPEPTFPSDAPRARIDYVWHSPGIAVSRGRVVDTRASDHRPLVVEG